MISQNIIVSHLVELCYQHGIKHIVLSPGSRNAPFTISFNEDPRFTCYIIPDERAAAFFALGLAQFTNTMTAVCCTSGTASLNYGPALAEAFYQRIPMLAITADRPEEWIDQGVGQSIRQKNLFQNFILKGHSLPSDQDKHAYAARLINEVLLFGNGTKKGPVHLNVPLYEPLYGVVEKPKQLPRVIEKIKFLHRVAEDEITKLGGIWNSNSKKLIVIGAIAKNDLLQEMVSRLSDDPSVVILTETHGNLVDDRFHPSIDRIIEGIQDNRKEEFTPDILMTFGQNLISKKLKTLLHGMDIQEHWHIDPDPDIIDTYHALSKQIDDTPIGFLRLFVKVIQKKQSNYASLWNTLESATKAAHYDFLESLSFSDFYCFREIMKILPSGTYLQMGNSTSVRYIQLITQRNDVFYHGNRGVSGIDGCTSTAAGASWENKDAITCLICGDVSFLYDVNGLWHHYLNIRLRIIIINNNGGGIFRIIKGPSGTNQLEEFFESRHNVNAENIAKTYGLDYYKASDEKSLKKELSHFFEEKPAASILEIFTPIKNNDLVLKDYFKHINKALKNV